MRVENLNSFQRKNLAELVSFPVKWDCPLSQFTSISIGGPANAVVRVDKRSELPHLLKFLVREKIQWLVIGRGTNLLVKDSGFPGVVLILGEDFLFVSDSIEDSSAVTCIRAGGGCSLGRLSSYCTERGLAGLEFASGIPGTVGGAVIMNAGAWGSDISSVLESITLITSTGERTINRKDLNFGYRCWNDYGEFAGKVVVADVKLCLSQEEPEAVRAYCRTLQRKRKENQPGNYLNAGSFFKNPAGDSAGRLIEGSGFKGARVGGAMVSEKHANFLVNNGGATAADVMTLMHRIQEKVKKDSGISLQPEVHFI